VCGEFLAVSIRESEEARTRTNGVAKRGERDSVRAPEWRSGKQGLEEDAQRGELQQPERRKCWSLVPAPTMFSFLPRVWIYEVLKRCPIPVG